LESYEDVSVTKSPVIHWVKDLKMFFSIVVSEVKILGKNVYNYLSFTKENILMILHNIMDLN